ncbi:sulfur oxidation c-type cytochrome SoxA [Nitratifractor sp.]|uniref:sulfur oxidation c-type cytochrome SoxA n=1 Tax=Nitratifractor sp. TaxID=2268144 RepID=UPI0025FE4CEE|nr:sulfur oxidation c-type cytochrome SoxA [Nitratifractor sp.]
MIGKIAKTSVAVLIGMAAAQAASFNTQAEKDRQALESYFVKKFSNPEKNKRLFPYANAEDFKSLMPVKKVEDFRMGSYAYDKQGRSQYEEINEMPPYEDNVDAGEELYNSTKGIKQCFPDPTIAGEYPKFDAKQGKVVTLSVAINDCLKANGQKPWKLTKGKLADLEAYFAFKSKEAGKKVHITIPSEAAAAAYERGKKNYYSQRGYLKLSCATCHVQGAGNRVRREVLSPLLGHTTHFPVYRLKWQGLGTLERRIKGCEKNQGENPHKPGSQWMSEMLYFMAYMSNGLPVDGPDIRK